MAHVGYLGLHTEVFEADVLFGEFDAETAGLVVEGTLMLSFQDFLTYLAVTSIEVVSVDRNR